MVAALEEEEPDSPEKVFVAVPPTPPLVPGARVGASGSENREGSCNQTAFAIRNLTVIWRLGRAENSDP